MTKIIQKKKIPTLINAGNNPHRLIFVCALHSRFEPESESEFDC